MNKISRILPENPRTKSVDLKSSHPIRPGVPAFGRPEGSTASMRDRITFSQQARDLLEQQSPIKRSTELNKTALARKISDDFFTQRVKPLEEPSLTGSPLDTVGSGESDLDTSLAGEDQFTDKTEEMSSEKLSFPSVSPAASSGPESSDTLGTVDSL